MLKSREFKLSVGLRSKRRFSELDRFRVEDAISGKKPGGDAVEENVGGVAVDEAMEVPYGFFASSKASESLTGEPTEVPVNSGGNRVKSRRRDS